LAAQAVYTFECIAAMPKLSPFSRSISSTFVKTYPERFKTNFSFVIYLFIYLLFLMEKSKLAKHAYEEGHNVWWNEAKVVQIETKRAENIKKQLIWCVITNPNSQPSLEISPIWIPPVLEAVSRLQGNSV
jgi:hypothetical protein